MSFPTTLEATFIGGRLNGTTRTIPAACQEIVIDDPHERYTRFDYSLVDRKLSSMFVLDGISKLEAAQLMGLVPR